MSWLSLTPYFAFVLFSLHVCVVMHFAYSTEHFIYLPVLFYKCLKFVSFCYTFMLMLFLLCLCLLNRCNAKEFGIKSRLLPCIVVSLQTHK